MTIRKGVDWGSAGALDPSAEVVSSDAVAAQVFQRAIDDGVFDGLEDAEVAALASCITYEHRSSDPAPAALLPSAELRRRVSRLENVWQGLERI